MQKLNENTPSSITKNAGIKPAEALVTRENAHHLLPKDQIVVSDLEEVAAHIHDSRVSGMIHFLDPSEWVPVEQSVDSFFTDRDQNLGVLNHRLSSSGTAGYYLSRDSDGESIKRENVSLAEFMPMRHAAASERTQLGERSH